MCHSTTMTVQVMKKCSVNHFLTIISEKVGPRDQILAVKKMNRVIVSKNSLMLYQLLLFFSCFKTIWCCDHDVILFNENRICLYSRGQGNSCLFYVKSRTLSILLAVKKTKVDDINYVVATKNITYKQRKKTNVHLQKSTEF